MYSDFHSPQNGWHRVITYMCIQSVILNRKHNHEKWNGILLIKEPVKILAKWLAVTARGLYRLGPGFSF